MNSFGVARTTIELLVSLAMIRMPSASAALA